MHVPCRTAAAAAARRRRLRHVVKSMISQSGPVVKLTLELNRIHARLSPATRGGRVQTGDGLIQQLTTRRSLLNFLIPYENIK